jgi:choline-sulfatase
VIYTTDHGDNLGVRGMWGKSVHYEESNAIPMIMAGPDVPAGHTVNTPVTLVDMYQTILECTGLNSTKDEAHLPGKSLFSFVANEEPERVALSEYHAAGSITAMYMLRKGRWKYTHYVGYRPELFDLKDDPGEVNDLGESAAHEKVRAAMERELRKILDPEAVCAQAFADQAATVAANGASVAISATRPCPA